MDAESLHDRSPSLADAENWLALGAGALLESLTDEQVLFLSDIFPTGYMAAENCRIKPGDTVAVWGCGPVDQFAIKSADLLGAEPVIAIDRFAERLELASSQGRAETLNYEDVDVLDELRDMTGGQRPYACIEVVMKPGGIANA